ncbi:monocyte chemotactic protein 1B-like [Amphiprion ocellaris]|uniref:C-C motif chemokine n=1 Tax=Amphiprion ocellaris TaxID=80972 RepID=A0AAQ5Z7U0_AMPOC|nr:monocyte chemotactic protein 1B-like [Amphiprion ocellaris]
MTSLSFISLFLLTFMVSTASAQGGIGNCCRKLVDNQIHRDRLKEYYIEDSASCPLHAVVFTTMRGNRLCSDPVKLWTQTSMAYLDGKNWQKQHVTRNKLHH